MAKADRQGWGIERFPAPELRSRRCIDAKLVYPARVSEKAPQTYILHTVALFVVLTIAMVAFLRHQWG